LKDVAVPFDTHLAERDLAEEESQAEGIEMFPYPRWSARLLPHPKLYLDNEKARS
jgi:hypothetical protein